MCTVACSMKLFQNVSQGLYCIAADQNEISTVCRMFVKRLSWGWRYSCTVSVISVLDGNGWSVSCPGHFNPENETKYQLNKRLDGPQGRSGQVWKISPPPGFDPWTVQLQWVAIPIILSCSTFIIIIIFHQNFNRFHARFTAYCLNMIPVVCILVNIKRLRCDYL